LAGRAAACARHLLDHAETPAGGGRAWPSVDGRLLAGLAHGATGIALALARVKALAGEPGLESAARGAYDYERSLFSEAHRNWPVVGPKRGAPEEGARLMAAWCHGAPGVGLARALARPVLDDALVSSEIEAAMATTIEASRAGGDHLCCGALGRADVLLTVGESEGRPEWVAAAAVIASGVAERAARERRFALPGSAFEYRVFHPGFFKGLAGVGYGLLRVAAPARVPSVLGFQVPARNGELR
jgi:lantibiotic modifying enzyme